MNFTPKSTAIIAISLIAISVFFIQRQSSNKMPAPTNNNKQETLPTPTLSAAEEHMKSFDDGKTVMMMGGDFSPKVIYSKPGETLKFLNHESLNHALMADDHKSFKTDFIDAGGETTVKLPTTPGSYPFHVHEKQSNKMYKGGTIIIELEK